MSSMVEVSYLSVNVQPVIFSVVVVMALVFLPSLVTLTLLVPATVNVVTKNTYCDGTLVVRSIFPLAVSISMTARS